MKFNRPDKKSILLTFAVSIILFMGLYIAVTMTGITDGTVFSALTAQSSDGAGILINNPLTEQFRKEFSKPVSLSLAGGSVNVINVNIKAEEVMICSAEEDEVTVISEKELRSPLLKAEYRDGNINITSTGKIDTKVTVNIPEEIFDNNTISLNITSGNGYLSVRNLYCAYDDGITIASEGSIVSVAGVNCDSLNIHETLAPVLVDSCNGNILKVKSGTSIQFSGNFDEISLSAQSEIIALSTGRFNRMDASSKNGFISINTNDNLTGFTARLENCQNNVIFREGTTLSPLSRPGKAVYEYGDGSAKINITDTDGEIIIQ